MANVTFDERYCKGCGLCVEVCPVSIIVLDPDTLTDKGYHPAMVTDMTLCTGCANCGIMCPDVAITVER
jgi:2-oxoglutarate ferredoxin oxidoreductase subunit delta